MFYSRERSLCVNLQIQHTREKIMVFTCLMCIRNIYIRIAGTAKVVILLVKKLSLSKYIYLYFNKFCYKQ